MFMIAVRNNFPHLNVRSRDSYFLPCHPNRFILRETRLEPWVRLDEELIPNREHCVYIVGGCHGPAISRIYGAQTPRDRHQRIAFGRAETAQLSRHFPPAHRLAVKVDDDDCRNLARPSAERQNPATRD
jgi:hypothetical protein